MTRTVRLARLAGLEQTAQMRDVTLNGLAGSSGRALAPQRIHDPVAGDHLATVNQQEREQGALAPARHRNQSPFAVANLERT